jgi:membrane-associated phospholipid phosphatase
VPVKLLEPFREDRTGRLINLGAGKSLDQLGGGLWLLGLIVGSPDLRDAGMGCVAAEKANGIPRHYLYKSVSRQRPILEDGSVGDPWDIEVPGDDEDWFDNSFFGGHGANIMACASFFNHRFDLGYAEYAIYALATGIGIGRVADQRHWASDALVGGIFGFAIGKYVAERSQKRADRREQENATGSPAAERESGGPADWLEGLYLGRNDGVTFVGMRRTF